MANESICHGTNDDPPALLNRSWIQVGFGLQVPSIGRIRQRFGGHLLDF